MNKLTIIKSGYLFVLGIIFTVFVVMPAIVPTSAVADNKQERLERRLSAQQRSAARLLKRISKADLSSEEQAELSKFAAARCGGGVAGLPCTDKNGAAVTVTKVNECGMCTGAGPLGITCIACCDQLSGGAGRRSQRCQDNNCA